MFMDVFCLDISSLCYLTTIVRLKNEVISSKTIVWRGLWDWCLDHSEGSLKF